MHNSKHSDQIPSMNLRHDGMDVLFAYRTMEDIEAMQQGVQDMPHRHNYYTVLWARNACGQHFIDYREYQIKPNKVFFVGPGQVHQVIAHAGASGVVIMFTRQFLEQQYIGDEFIQNLGLFADVPDIPPLHLSDDGVRAISFITQQIEDAFREDNYYRNDRLGAYLKLFLIECNRFAVIPKEDFPKFDQSGKDIVMRFKKLLEANYTMWHKVNHYADALNITPDYLNNVLKTAIGKSAKEYIQNRIILEAKRLGVHTSKSSKEIAFELGFSEPSHFSRFYKNIEKESFTTFRKALYHL